MGRDPVPGSPVATVSCLRDAVSWPSRVAGVCGALLRRWACRGLGGASKGSELPPLSPWAAASSSGCRSESEPARRSASTRFGGMAAATREAWSSSPRPVELPRALASFREKDSWGEVPECHKTTAPTAITATSRAHTVGRFNIRFLHTKTAKVAKIILQAFAFFALLVFNSWGRTCPAPRPTRSPRPATTR